jgi:uncharacterized membrane protein YccC
LPAPCQGGGQDIKAFIIVAIATAAGLVLAAAFLPSTGLPLTIAGSGVALCALIAALLRG